MNRIPAVASALLLSGCITLTSIDNHAKPPAEWPANMKEVVQVESFMRVQDICRNGPLILVGVWRLACTIAVLPYHAYIIVTYDPAHPEMAHERMHGQGYGHPFSSWVADTIAFWKGQGWKPGDQPKTFEVLRYDPQQKETVKVTSNTGRGG